MLHFPHSIITSPVHVTSPRHQHLNLNFRRRNRHLTVMTITYPERQFGDTSQTVARMVSISTICHHKSSCTGIATYESTKTTQKTTTSNPIITILTFHVPTCSHQTSIFPSRDLLDTCLCFQSRSHPLGTAQKRTIDQTLSVATNLGRHSPFALSSESVCQCRCNAHKSKACLFAKPQQQQHLLLLSLLSCPSPELVCLLCLP